MAGRGLPSRSLLPRRRPRPGCRDRGGRPPALLPVLARLGVRGRPRGRRDHARRREHHLGRAVPLDLAGEEPRLLGAEEAVRYLTLPSLPTMAGREAGRPVPSRGRVGQSANPIPHREGEQVAEAVLKLAGRRPEPTVAPSPAGPSPAPQIAPPPPRGADAVGPAAAAALGDEAEV